MKNSNSQGHVHNSASPKEQPKHTGTSNTLNEITTQNAHHNHMKENGEVAGLGVLAPVKSKTMARENHKNHAEEQEGHAGGHAAHAEMFKKRFFVSLFLAIPILLFSPMMGVGLPFTVTFPGSEWVVLILATVLFFYGGMPFLQGAKGEFAEKKPAMMTLISLGITVAYVYSVYAFIANNLLDSSKHVMDFFWELASLILIMLLGHWIEMRAVNNAGDALKRMAELLPNSAILQLPDGGSKEIALTDVILGDHLMVMAGGKIPTDGVVLSGSTSVNEAMVTGEAKDVVKNANDIVIGGSINGAGTIVIRVTGTGESGYLAQVMALVNNAQSEKSKAESLSDKVASLLFYFALVVGILAFVIWMMLGKGLDFSLERLVAVLIIACPHALGLAIPLVTARSTSIAAQNGLLIQNRQALETARKVDVVVMDKTGTLTEGNFAVSAFVSYSDQYSNELLLQYIGALEQGSSHPLAIGVLNKLKKLQLEPKRAQEITNIPGAGLQGTVDGKKMKLVSAAYLDSENIAYDKKEFMVLSSLGNSISYLLENGVNIGVLAQGDQIKAESKAMVERLLQQKTRPIMLTGDNKQSAEVVAKYLGIAEYYAQARPEDKEKLVRKLQDEGLVVMMVGDGVNDAPSLARADIGVAIGAGTDVAIDSADIILVKSNPMDILRFLELAKNTTRKTIQNLWWGAGYNVIAIPLAAGILAEWGFVLSPAIGAILMSLSTVIVAINAMSLRINKNN